MGFDVDSLPPASLVRDVDGRYVRLLPSCLGSSNDTAGTVWWGRLIGTCAASHVFGQYTLDHVICSFVSGFAGIALALSAIYLDVTLRRRLTGKSLQKKRRRARRRGR